MADNTRYYAYLPKGSSRNSFKTVSTSSYASALVGESEYKYYPYTSSVDVKYFYEGSDRPEINSLKNALNSYTIFSKHYTFSSSLGNKSDQKINLISIPSVFFGSSIKKRSVKLDFNVSGTLLGRIEDLYGNGELIETTGSNSGSVAGVVLYNHGFIVLTGSWNLDNNHTEGYIFSPSSATDNPKWVYWGAGYNLTGAANPIISSSYDMDFDGVNYIQTVTMMAHAEKGELNHSNNPTYIKYAELSKHGFVSSSTSFFESDQKEIKNITKYAYENYTGSLEKQTYITKIGIYDERKNLIAFAKLSKPIRKTEGRDFTFKLKLDF